MTATGRGRTTTPGQGTCPSLAICQMPHDRAGSMRRMRAPGDRMQGLGGPHLAGGPQVMDFLPEVRSGPQPGQSLFRAIHGRTGLKRHIKYRERCDSMNTKTSRNIATGAIAGLAAIVVLMMVPTTDTAPQGPAFYGMAEVVQMGSDGEVLSSQTVHNRIVDQGEELMLDALFDTGVTFDKFNVICLGDDVAMAIIDDDVTGEALDADDHFIDTSTAFGGSSQPCKTVENVERLNDGNATLSATFEAARDLQVGSAFNSVWVCNAQSADADEACSSDFDGGGSGAGGDGILAVVGLPTAQSIEADSNYSVTYTLDLSSDMS
ncbi:hypothetical protein CENSYa_1101 [Cenarchaeum symbiosum A]|uniref:Uncharacterized protein n=1 Tax=Cenarchaeum symbiosum (strain A) TaxID=414004 RepID=A0RWL3_CENSY|nr:hypothetical protein CENSYa_1101 [Cenarchaeum symbiosum A]